MCQLGKTILHSPGFPICCQLGWATHTQGRFLWGIWRADVKKQPFVHYTSCCLFACSPPSEAVARPAPVRASLWVSISDSLAWWGALVPAGPSIKLRGNLEWTHLSVLWAPVHACEFGIILALLHLTIIFPSQPSAAWTSSSSIKYEANSFPQTA